MNSFEGKQVENLKVRHKLFLDLNAGNLKAFLSHFGKKELRSVIKTNDGFHISALKEAKVQEKEADVMFSLIV